MASSQLAGLDALRYSNAKIHDHFTDNTSVFEVVVRLLLEKDYELPAIPATTVGKGVYVLDNSLFYAYRIYKQIRERWGFREAFHVPVRVVETPEGFACKSQISQAEIELTRPSRVEFRHSPNEPLTATTNTLRPSSSRRWASRSAEPAHAPMSTVAAAASKQKRTTQPSTPSAASNGKPGRACADFVGTSYGNDYLVFSAGDILYQLPSPAGQDAVGWLYGFAPGSGNYGWFPPQYWKPQPSVDNPPPTQPVPQPVSQARNAHAQTSAAVRSPSALSTSRPPAPPIPAGATRNVDRGSHDVANDDVKRLADWLTSKDDQPPDGNPAVWQSVPSRRQTSRPRSARLRDGGKPRASPKAGSKGEVAGHVDGQGKSSKAASKAEFFPQGPSPRANTSQQFVATRKAADTAPSVSRERNRVAGAPPGVSHRAWVRDLEQLDDDAARYVVARVPSRGPPVKSTPSSPVSDTNFTVPQRSKSQPPRECESQYVTGIQRNKAEVEVAELLKRWVAAHLLLPRGRDKKPSRVVLDLFAKVAPELTPYLTAPDRVTEPPSVNAAVGAVDVWAAGDGQSLGPFNQVEKMLTKMRGEVNRCEGQLEGHRRVGTGLRAGSAGA